MNSVTQSRIDELVLLIKGYAKAYYTGVAEISDEEFDNLVDELRALDPENEILKTPGWGYNPDPSSRKTSHLYGLVIGSLGKVKDVTYIQENLKDINTRVSAKLDGLSAVSYYENGYLKKAVTRGNGVEGLDITDKIRIIAPEACHLRNPFTGAVRGEVVMSNENWEKIKDRFSDNPSANQRNVASGILNRKDTSDDLNYLDYVTYKILYDDSEKYANGMTSAVSEIRRLKSYGLKTVPYANVNDWKSDVLETIYNGFCKIYPCDGLVLTNIAINIKNGTYDHEEVAYKFQAESKIVKVINVTYNLTRTGRMVPLVWIEPTELSGVIVQKCTGFNAQFIRDNKINIGSKIRVCRSNEVIPYIMEVIEPSSEGLLPTDPNLEWAGTDLIVPGYEGGLAYHFITIVAPRDGAGWSLYSSIVDTFELNNYLDLAGFLGDVSLDFGVVFEKLKKVVTGDANRIKAKDILMTLTKPINPVVFLVACGVNGLSWTTAEKILKGYPDFFKDVYERKINEDKLYAIDGIGYSIVESIRNSLDKIRTLYEIVTLEELKFEEKKEVKFKVAITGALSMKRADFDKLLKDHGIEQGNVKDCKYLITNTPDSGSSKNQDARKYGVEIISEEEFVKKYFA